MVSLTTTLSTLLVSQISILHCTNVLSACLLCYSLRLCRLPLVCRKDNVLELWAYLLELLRARRLRLELSLKLQKVFQEMLYILDWMDEIKVVSVDSLIACIACYLLI